MNSARTSTKYVKTTYYHSNRQYYTYLQFIRNTKSRNPPSHPPATDDSLVKNRTRVIVPIYHIIIRCLHACLANITTRPNGTETIYSPRITEEYTLYIHKYIHFVRNNFNGYNNGMSVWRNIVQVETINTIHEIGTAIYPV